MKEEEIVFNKKKSNNVHIETIKYWEIMDKLVKRIEERDPRTPKLNTRKTVKGDSVTGKYQAYRIGFPIISLTFVQFLLEEKYA